MGCAHIQPGKRGEHLWPGLRAIEQDDIAKRANLTLQQRVDCTSLRNVEPRRFGIVAQFRPQVRAIGKDRQRQRHDAIVGCGIGEIGLGHDVRLPFS